MDTPKKAGRPRTGNAMTQAQRQRAYRGRLVQSAMLKPREATTTALIANIKHHCASIDTNPDHADIARRLVAPVIRELCARYKIKLT